MNLYSRPSVFGGKTRCRIERSIMAETAEPRSTSSRSLPSQGITHHDRAFQQLTAPENQQNPPPYQTLSTESNHPLIVIKPSNELRDLSFASDIFSGDFFTRQFKKMGLLPSSPNYGHSNTSKRKNEIDYKHRHRPRAPRTSHCPSREKLESDSNHRRHRRRQ